MNSTILQQKKIVDHITWILIVSTTFVWNIFHSKKNWVEIIKNVYYLSGKVPINLVQF